MTKIIFKDCVIDNMSSDEAALQYPRLWTAKLVLERLHDKLVELPASEHLGKVESFQKQIQEILERLEERINDKVFII